VLELILGLFPLDIPPPDSPTPGGPGAPVYPVRSNGFAAYLLGGFFALGLIILVGVLLGLKPKRIPPEGSRGVPQGSDTVPGPND
jgi:hypothetical protein